MIIDPEMFPVPDPEVIRDYTITTMSVGMILYGTFGMVNPLITALGALFIGMIYGRNLERGRHD